MHGVRRLGCHGDTVTRPTDSSGVTPQRQQLTVTLPADLVQRVKHHAIDTQLSLSDLVAQALEAQLVPGPGVTLRPMVHVADMAAAVTFFEAMGAAALHGSRDGDWVLLALGDDRIGLLAHPPNPEQGEGVVELNFEATESLDVLEARLRGAGVTIARPTSDEGFGRQLQVAGPDGLLVKIDELEPDLYT